MRNELWIVAVALVLSLGVGALVMQNSSFTGYAVFDDDEVSVNESFTREDALQIINESQEILGEMRAANFSGTLVQDLLVEAEKIFQQVEYAEVLRGNVNASISEKFIARDALSLADWRFINYSDVLEYTDEIVIVRELAFYVRDLLSIQESFLGAERDESGKIVSFSAIEDAHLERFRFLINGIEEAIREERFEEALELAELLKEEADIRRTEVFTTLVLARGVGNFLLRYWYVVLLVVILLVVGGYFSFKIIRRSLLKKKINQLKVEQKILMALMKRAQIERFKENKISGLVYNIRVKKFEEKLNTIKEDLPVFEKRLAGVKTKKKKAEKKV